MHRLATWLLLYQGLYWLYLLHVSGTFSWADFPYAIFRLSILTKASIAARLLLIGCLARIHEATITNWYKTKCYLLLMASAGLALLFLLFDKAFTLYEAPYAFPLLLAALMLMPSVCGTDSSFAIKQPRANHKAIVLPTRKGALPIASPQRGIYILGNQGSGKTRFVLEPLLYQMIQKRYAGLVYDYDYEGTPAAPHKSYCLSKFVYNAWRQEQPPGVAFETINFTDLTRTRRINPFAPNCIQDRAYLEEYVAVLLKNLVPEANQGKNFWLNSAQVLLKSILVFLDNNHSQHCTLPHALAIALQPIDVLLAAMRHDEEAYTYASSIYDALDAGEKGAGQLAGITATLKVSLQTLLQPNIFWVLTGNDLPLRINDKNRPMLLCIGNYPPAKAAYSPLIALIITLCFKAMYGHGKVKSFVAIDELPTLFLPDLSELPATARKYGIATIACLQSNAQLAHTYGQVGAQKIQQTLVNKFIGNTEDASAVYGSELVGKKEKTLEANSQSTSVQATSYRTTYGKSFSTQERALLAPQDFMRFEPGEFAGKVAEGCPPFFHTRLKAVATYDRAFQNARLKDLPTLQAVEEEAVMANYQRVWKEVKAILASYKQDAG